MKPIVIFGAGKIAEVVLHFLLHASDRTVAACTVDRSYFPGPEWNGLPVVPFEELAQAYPPLEYDLFVALGYQDMNKLRAMKCAEARALGYTLASYVHPLSGLPSDCVFGDNCFVMHHVMIQPRVKLGNNVFVWSGAMIGHHSEIGDDCWLTSSANISGSVSIGRGCFFAVNSTIGNNVIVGNHCFIGINAVVTQPTDDEQVFVVESTKPFRLNSRQFLRMSRFSDL